MPGLLYEADVSGGADAADNGAEAEGAGGAGGGKADGGGGGGKGRAMRRARAADGDGGASGASGGGGLMTAAAATMAVGQLGRNSEAGVELQAAPSRPRAASDESESDGGDGQNEGAAVAAASTGDGEAASEAPAVRVHTPPPPPPPVDAAFLARIQEYYCQHNPAKCGEAESIVAAFSGQQTALLVSLDRKYGTNESGLRTPEWEHAASSLAPQYERPEEEEEEEDSSIKLGLGDFIFYSVLVSRAAAFGFATWAAVALTVLMGLGGTLALLAIAKKALPALPISIFIGVAVFFLCNALVTPFLQQVAVSGVLV